MGLFSSKSKSESYGAPWAPTIPPLVAASREVGRIRGTPFEFYPEQTYAGQTEAEQQAIEQLKAGPGIVRGLFGPAQAAQQYALGQPSRVMEMGLQDVASNPYLADVADTIQSRVMRNLEENILPTLDTPGQMGGTRAGVAQGIASRGTSDVLAEQLANLYGGAWQAGLGQETARLGQGLSAAQGAMGITPSLARMGAVMPADLLMRAGTLERAEEQRAISEDMARHEFEQMEPWRRAGMTFETLMPAGSAFGSRVTKGKSTPSGFQQIGGALSLGSTLFGMGRDLFGGGGAAGDMFGFSPFGQTPGTFYDPWGSGFGGQIDPWSGTLIPY